MSQNQKQFDHPLPDLNGKDILVTGGTGSFGQSFVRHVLEKWHPNRLIVFSRDEQKQYDMARAFGGDTYPCMRYFIGDVRDTDRLELAMREVDYVVHAAALKHIPTAEYNPFECIHTNVMGSVDVADDIDNNGLFIGNHYYDLAEQLEHCRRVPDHFVVGLDF